MRAVRLDAYGDYDQLKVVDVPTPEPGDGEVLVRMTASSINPFDNTIRLGYVSQVNLPLVLGAEGVGTVVQSRNASLPEGTRVMLVGTYGFARDGTWQEFCTANANEAVPAPANLSDVEAAATPVAYLAGQLALTIACGFRPGMTLLIPGVGGSVANAAIQLAKAHGAARVISTAGRSEKVDKASELGIDDVIDLTKESLSAGVMRLTDGKGVEVALDSVGGDITGEALKSLAPNGLLVHMGYPAGTDLSVDSMSLIWKPARVQGFNMYFQSPEAFGEAWKVILGLLSEGKVKPLVAKTFPLEEVAEAQRYLIEDRPMGKVVLTF